MCCFYPFYAIITIFFDQEMFGLAPLLYVDAERFGGIRGENYFKTSKRQNRHNDVMHESRLTPLMLDDIYYSRSEITEIPVGYAIPVVYARRRFLAYPTGISVNPTGARKSISSLLNFIFRVFTP